MSYLVEYDKDNNPTKPVVYVISDTYTTGGEKYDDNDWDHEPIIKHTNFHYLSPYEPPDRMFYSAVPISDESFKLERELYFGFVYYSDGDTFGYTEFNWEPITAHKTFIGAEQEIDFIINNYNGYKPWEGYFAKLTSKEIIKLLKK